MIMKETVLDKVPRVLREKLDITKKYVAAVSGGADSLAFHGKFLEFVHVSQFW